MLINEQLKNHPFWCLWKYQIKNSKKTKVPYSAKTGRRAKANNKNTFCDYETVVKSYSKGGYDGFGVGIFNQLSAIDIDHCITDTGEISETAQEIIDLMRSYTEISPSGKGIRILFYIGSDWFYDKSKYYINNAKIGLEIYVSGVTSKFVTITGNSYSDLPIRECTSEISIVLEKYMLRPAKVYEVSQTEIRDISLSDERIIEIASHAKNKEKFISLWNGSWDGYNSQSEADLALCQILAFYTQCDHVQMDRLFRMSRLMRDKWDENRGNMTYGQMQIEYACNTNKNRR